MTKFAAGLALGCFVGIRYKEEIVTTLEKTLAKLELQRDILLHDHPELRD